MKNILALLTILIGHSLFAQNKLEVGLRNGEVLYPSTIEYKNPLFKSPTCFLMMKRKLAWRA